MTILSNILTCLPVLFALTNTQIYPAKGWKKYTTYTIFILGYAFLFPYIAAYIIPVNLLGMWTLFAIFDKKNAAVNSIASMLGWAASVVLDYILVFLLPLFNISIADLISDTKSVKYIAFCAFISVVIYTATHYFGGFIRYLYFKKFKLDTVSPKLMTAVCVDIIAIVLIFMVGNMYIYHFKLGGRAIFITGILYIAQLIVMVFIAYQIYTVVKKETALKLEYKYAKQYSDHLEASNREYRSVKHEFENTLNSLVYYMDNDLYGNANQWLKDHIKPYYKASLDAKDKALALLINLNVMELKSIFYAEIIKAINADISINLFIPEPIDAINMAPYDLMRIMGIFLDNAIEGALETKEKYVYVSIKLNAASNKIFIEIQNTTVISSLPNGSTKGDGRGMGLLNAQSILKKYPNANLVTNIVSGKYVQSLSIG